MCSSEQDSAQEQWVARLCPECGLCCDGVLFADVGLVSEDDVLMLEGSGLVVKPVGRGRRFDQPCSCFDGRHCSIYAQRPTRCRQFNCHTLKQAHSGQIERHTALRRITDAKAESARVRGLLRELGQHDEHLPLTRRYQQLMSQPVDLALDESSADKRGELMLAVNDLMHRLHRDFLAEPRSPASSG